MKKHFILVASCVFLAAMLISCANINKKELIPMALDEDDSKFVSVTMYYRDDEGWIVPMSRRVWKQADILNETMYMQMANAENGYKLKNIGLQPILSRKMEYDIKVSGATAIVNIEGDSFNAKSKEDEKNKVDCIVNSLCSIDGIDAVRITVDGNEIGMMEQGTSIAGNLLPRAINVIESDNGDTKDTVTLYYLSELGRLVFPINVPKEGVGDAKWAIEAMINPNEELGLASIFPDGCKLLGVSMNDGEIKLDFSKEFINLAEHPEFESRVLTALNSVCIETVKSEKMIITVEGNDYEPMLSYWPSKQSVETFNILGEEYAN